MCGITGAFSNYGSFDGLGYYNAHLLIKHRGLDDEGFVSLNRDNLISLSGDDTIEELKVLPHIKTIEKSNLIMGHRRLSIIDLSKNGHQPFIDEKQNYAITFNGEIYNYIEIKEELIKLGYHFSSNSDTEVALKAYIEWKEGCFNKFNGMWALAIYDRSNNKIVLSRDRFGVKPLYFAIKNRALYFSSEMRFIKAITGSNEMDFNTINEYSNHMRLNCSYHTFYKEINELEPAKYLIFDGEKIIKEKIYWDYKPEVLEYSNDEALSKFQELFEDSLKLRMRSDVEVGSLLSGGLDSTVIVAALHKLGYLDNKKFKTFSAVFNEEEFSELKYIDETEKLLPIDGHHVYIDGNKLKDDILKILYYNEEPFRSLSVVSQYKLYEKINLKGVKVVLNGQGADECFGGYSRDYMTLFVHYFISRKLKKLCREFELYMNYRNISFNDFILEISRSLIYSGGHRDVFNHVLFRQIKKASLREYLRYDDRNSMAFNVESRAPFMDYRLIEFAFSLDARYKINNFENKKIVRDYARPIIPESILNRRDKMGFISPQQIWQARELKKDFDEVFNNIEKEGLLNQNSKKIARKYRLYLDGKFQDWSYIWRIYCLKNWLNMNNA